MQKIRKVTYSKISFWNEIIADNPTSETLDRHSTVVSGSENEILSCYTKIISISENCTKIMEIYGAYLSLITNNSIESHKIYERMMYAIKSKKKSSSLALEDRDFGIVQISNISYLRIP